MAIRSAERERVRRLGLPQPDLKELDRLVDLASEYISIHEVMGAPYSILALDDGHVLVVQVTKMDQRTAENMARAQFCMSQQGPYPNAKTKGTRS